MGACWTKEGKGERLDAKEHKLEGCVLQKDGEGLENERAGKPQSRQESTEESQFKLRAVDIKSDNEQTNVRLSINLNIFNRQ